MKTKITGHVNIKTPPDKEQSMIDIAQRARRSVNFILLEGWDIALPFLKKRYAKK